MKSLFWLVIKVTLFYIINSDNQRLIHHIHCFVNFLGSYSMIFTFNYIYQIHQTFFIQENIFVFTMTCCSNIFIDTTCFFMFTTIIYQKQICPWLQFNKFFNSNGSCFIFLLATNFFLIIIISWTSRIITKVKFFLSVVKFSCKYSVLISYIRLSVSMNNNPELLLYLILI